jgi:hypothetical protein
LFAIVEFIQDVEREEHYMLNAFLNLVLIGKIYTLCVGFFVVFYEILFAGISVYFWICIFSFYKKLREEEANIRRTVEPPPYVAPRFEKDGDLPYVTLA